MNGRFSEVSVVPGAIAVLGVYVQVSVWALIEQTQGDEFAVVGVVPVGKVTRGLDRLVLGAAVGGDGGRDGHRVRPRRGRPSPLSVSATAADSTGTAPFTVWLCTLLISWISTAPPVDPTQP